MPKKDSLFYRAARQTMIEYFQKTSLNGFGLLYFIRRRKYQRIFWSLLILAGISFAIYVVLFILINFLREPTVTSMHSQHYAIWNVPFPAVAICSVNKLSRRAVAAYVEKISRTRYDYWINKMQLLSGLFESETVNFTDAVAFQEELESVINRKFDTKTLLRQLSPSCNEILLHCRWGGETRVCNELFEMKPITAGYCCTFNFKDGNASADSLFYPNGTGTEMGLSVLLNSSTDDYFYKTRSTNGFHIQIFSPKTFPSLSTGDVKEFFVSPGASNNVRIVAISQITSSQAHHYPVHRRHCYFEDELGEDYNWSYSQPECLTRCKLISMLELCGCVPYYAPSELLQFNATHVYCDLRHVECLERHRLTWQNLQPIEPSVGEMSATLKADLRNSLSCSSCLPLCSYNLYSFRKETTNLCTAMNSRAKRILMKPTTKKLSCEQQSLVNLYFSTPYATQYSKNVLYNWYEIIASIGGVIGICMGCSLISGFEIIYFVGFRLFENYYKMKKGRSVTD